MASKWYRLKAAECARDALTALTDTSRAAFSAEEIHWTGMAVEFDRRAAELVAVSKSK